MSRGQRRVVQAYRRFDEDAKVANPFPNVASGARAILASPLSQAEETSWQNIEPAKRFSRDKALQPAPTLSANVASDLGIRAHPPKRLRDRDPETIFRIDYGDLTPVAAKRQDTANYSNGEAVRARLRPGEFAGAHAVAHTHPPGQEGANARA